MGSFNTTCFVTQQTISTKNPCYILPIKQSGGHSGVQLIRNEKPAVGTSIADSTCYADCFWKPMSGFIKATYNDYGQVTINFEAEKDNILALFGVLNCDAYVTLAGENKFHDVPFDIQKCIDTKNIEQAWDMMWEAAVHELRVFVRPYANNSPTQFTFAIMSEQAYDYLLNYSDSIVGWSKTSWKREDRINSVFSELEKRMEEFNSLTVHNGEYAVGGPRYTNMRSIVLKEIVDDMIRGGSNVSTPYSVVKSVIDISQRSSKLEDFSAEDKAKLKELMEFGYIMNALDSMNIKISPMVYASQDYNNSIGKDYAKMIKTVSAQINKQQKKIYEE